MSKTDTDIMDKIYFNKYGCAMKIIEYNSSKDVIVEFQDEFCSKVHTNMRNIRAGSVKNPYYPSVFGVGIIGNIYPTSSDENVPLKEYTTWKAMLNRCYYEKKYNNRTCYDKCTVCDEWLYYDNFYEWLHKQPNFKKLIDDGIRFDVDKDIIDKNNSIYEPNKCVVVPHYINNIFIKHKQQRGDLPIGVSADNRYKPIKYDAFLSRNGIQERIGIFNSVESAFLAYKKEKEIYIKQVAQIEFIKGNITKRCYDAMMRYKIEITD